MNKRNLDLTFNLKLSSSFLLTNVIILVQQSQQIQQIVCNFINCLVIRLRKTSSENNNKALKQNLTATTSCVKHILLTYQCKATDPQKHP